MIIKGVEFPEQLILDQRAGKLVIFAGAGVSLDPPSSLPNFVDLTEEIVSRKLKKHEKSQLDQVLGASKQAGVNAHRVTKPPVAAASVSAQPVVASPVTIGGVDSKDEENELLSLMEWVAAQSLPEGSLMHEIVDPESGAPIAMLDLAWPNGLQESFSQPVAVLLNEEVEVHNLANNHGFRYFINIEDFKNYVLHDVMGEVL